MSERCSNTANPTPGRNRGLWLALTLTVLLVLYPLSGPVVAGVYLRSKSFMVDPTASSWVLRIYEPLIQVLRVAPESVRSTFDDYSNWWMRRLLPVGHPYHPDYVREPPCVSMNPVASFISYPHHYDIEPWQF